MSECNKGYRIAMLVEWNSLIEEWNSLIEKLSVCVLLVTTPEHYTYPQCIIFSGIQFILSYG